MIRCHHHTRFGGNTATECLLLLVVCQSRSQEDGSHHGRRIKLSKFEEFAEMASLQNSTQFPSRHIIPLKSVLGFEACEFPEAHKSPLTCSPYGRVNSWVVLITIFTNLLFLYLCDYSLVILDFSFLNHRCSSFECEIDRLRITKKVRVCGDCYNRLTVTT